MIKPVSPSEALVNKPIPDFVLKEVNAILSENFDGKSLTFTQPALVARILKNNPSIERKDFNLLWLNFEPLYREAGWTVQYDKPAYNEDYEPCWLFRAAK